MKFVGVTDDAQSRNNLQTYTTPLKMPQSTTVAPPPAVPTPTPVKNTISYPSEYSAPNDQKPSFSLGQTCESQPSQSMSSQVTPNEDYDDQPDLDFKPSIVVKNSSMKTISASSSLQDSDGRDDDKSVNEFDTNNSSHQLGPDCQNLSPIVELENRLTNDQFQASEDNKQSVEEIVVETKEPSMNNDDNEQKPSKGSETTVQSVLRNILQTKPSMPSPRWGHSMTLIDHSRVLVYGGQGFDNALENQLVTYNNIFIFNLQNKKWSQPPNCLGISRAWHTCTFLPDRQLMLSFGGESVNAENGKTKTIEQVMVLDTEIMLWYPPTCSGNVPLGRSGHTATYVAHSQEMVVFGGVSKRKWQTVVPVLDTCSWKWRNAKIIGNSPPARSYHSATAIDRAAKCGDGSSSRRLGIVIFGGNNDVKSFNSVHLLDTTGDSSGKWSWFQPNVSGTPPSPRTGHSAVLLEDGKTILIYGGWDPCADEDDEDGAEIFSDSFLLDTEIWSWSPGPSPRFVPKTEAMNAGGKRVGHSAVLAPGRKGTEVLVFGGRTPNDAFADDFQTLSVPAKSIGSF